MINKERDEDTSGNPDLVGRSVELETGDFGDLSSDLDVEAYLGVQASSNGSTTLGEEAEAGEDVFDACNAVGDLLHVAAEFLAEGKGCRVLQVSASDLDDGVERLGLRVQRVTELGESRDEIVAELGHGSDMHGSGETNPHISGSMELRYEGDSHVSLLLWLILTWSFG